MPRFGVNILTRLSTVLSLLLPASPPLSLSLFRRAFPRHRRPCCRPASPPPPPSMCQRYRVLCHPIIFSFRESRALADAPSVRPSDWPRDDEGNSREIDARCARVDICGSLAFAPDVRERASVSSSIAGDRARARARFGRCNYAARRRRLQVPSTRRFSLNERSVVYRSVTRLQRVQADPWAKSRQPIVA